MDSKFSGPVDDDDDDDVVVDDVVDDDDDFSNFDPGSDGKRLGAIGGLWLLRRFVLSLLLFVLLLLFSFFATFLSCTA